MTRYVLRRLGTLLVTLLGISVLTFAISHVVPGDPARLAAGPTATEESVQALRKQMGLDQPLPTQYLNYMTGLTRLDFGRSITTGRPVRDDLVQFFPATLELIFISFLLYLGIGVPLGVVSALTRGRMIGFVIRAFSLVGYAIPLFVTALWLQYAFYFKLGWLPSGGRLEVLLQAPSRVTGFYLVDSLLAGDTGLFVATLRHQILPAFSLALSLIAIAAGFTRTSMLNELSMDYIKMTRLKGLTRFNVIVKHALRNSLIPLVTVTGIQFGRLVGGSVLVETVFLWPGIGFYAYTSALNLDYAPLMGVTLMTSFFFVATNLLIDLLYPILDPRITLVSSR